MILDFLKTIFIKCLTVEWFHSANGLFGQKFLTASLCLYILCDSYIYVHLAIHYFSICRALLTEFWVKRYEILFMKKEESESARILTGQNNIWNGTYFLTS